MVKGQVISGKFGEIIIRQKSDEEFELGELLIAEKDNTKILLQIYELAYGSQISEQNLELISGMKLEENTNIDFFDEKLRNYKLAFAKNLITINEDNVKTSKILPGFFSEVREIKEQDLPFLKKPDNPLFIGNLRSGSKVMDLSIFLQGKDVLSHHVLIPASTGKGKSLDENEEVLIKQNNIFSIKSIKEIINNSSNFKGSKVVSMNPKNYSIDFKKITNFVRHKAPKFMYEVITESGREVMVTKDHNLYVLRDGKLKLLKTERITNKDYLPLPIKIQDKGNQKTLNIFELLKGYNEIYVCYNKELAKKLKPKKECVNILSKHLKKPIEKYNDFVNKKKRIKITLLKGLLKKRLIEKDLKSIELTDLHQSIKLKAIFPITKEFLQLIGYYVAEGCCLNNNTFRISCSEREGKILLSQIFKKLNLNYFWIKKKNKNMDVGVSSSIFIKLLKEVGIGRVSGEKRLPNFFMNISNGKLKTLLKTYFEGDGGVDKEKIIKKRNFNISTTTKSKKLANDICIALYRFSIFARSKKTRKKATNTKHKGDWYYRIKISGKTDLRIFLSEIGFQFERKNKVLKGLLNYKENTNVDLIPVNPKKFKIRRMETKLSQVQFSKKIGYSSSMISSIELGRRRPSRDLFNEILKRFKEFKDLERLNRFRWDRIKEIKKIKYNKKYVYDLTIKDNKTFLAGHCGLFVHNSNLTSVMLWNLVDEDYCGLLVLDPHDEYYGRNSLGLKDHAKKEKVSYYTSENVPPGCKTLKINLKTIKPNHLEFMDWSIPQKDALSLFYKKFGEKWIESIILEEKIENVDINEATLAVLKRRLMNVLDLEYADKKIYCNGVFDLNAGETIIQDIVKELEESKIVIVDTSSFPSNVEILIGSLITAEIFNKYKYYKNKGQLKDKPVISIVIEEAPRVIGKDVLEKGSNMFSTIAREGRKFKIGLIAITQLPSLIPREVLANINTKIILGMEMSPERQAIIESASQDLSADNRNIAALDKGEAIITSNFTRFAIPVKIPLFADLVKEKKESSVKKDFSGVKIE